MHGADGRWTPEQAWAWSRRHPTPLGFNFLPSTAVNSTEMWQEADFDITTIDRELGWAEGCGFNSCRVFLQYMMWQDNPEAFKTRLASFLSLAARHHLVTVPILLDDCAFGGQEPYLGLQAAPVAGLHNGGWTPSPGPAIGDERTCWPRLEAYIVDVIGAFASDERVLLWDLYNEPGNASRGAQSLPLLDKVFSWARRVAPQQPLTAATWGCATTDEHCLALSDIISFHEYGDTDALRARIVELRRHDRPLICTEWMARTRGSEVVTHLPLFAEESIGCYLWGLVNGKTQTHLPWEWAGGAAEPDLWFHDLFHTDGTAYNVDEVLLIKRLAPLFGTAAISQE